MPATDIDRQWFHSNPDREFRMRRQTPAEFKAWPIPPQLGMVAWCIIRKADGAAEEFALSDGDETDDDDEELVRLFDQLRDRMA